MANNPKWLEWAKKMQAIAQTGLEYATDKFDIERYNQLRDLSVEIVSQYTEIGETKIRDLFANEKGYQTPKVDVRAAIFQDNKILLVKEQEDGRWALPGGWVDIDTSLREAAIKEVHEEAGVDCRPQRIISLIDRRLHTDKPLSHAVFTFFVQCEFLGGSYIENIETSHARFFGLEEVPPLSEGRTNMKQLTMCFDVKDKPQHETYFD